MVSAADEERRQSTSVFSQADGSFAIDGLRDAEYSMRARLMGQRDEWLDDVEAGTSGVSIRMEPATGMDLEDQRPADSAFSMLEFDNMADKQNFKMMCSYCHQIGTIGFRAGTPGYMSPEQLRGGAIDGRSDLFAFGVVLQELLTGTHPFKKDSGPETMAAILNEAPSGKENLPAAIQPLVDRLLSKDATARPSHEEARSELQRFVERPELLQAMAAPRRPFVGRESELAELRALVERARSGKGNLVLIGGEPGVGKTRLTEEVCPRRVSRVSRARGSLLRDGGSSTLLAVGRESRSRDAHSYRPNGFAKRSGPMQPKSRSWCRPCAAPTKTSRSPSSSHPSNSSVSSSTAFASSSNACPVANRSCGCSTICIGPTIPASLCCSISRTISPSFPSSCSVRTATWSSTSESRSKKRSRSSSGSAWSRESRSNDYRRRWSRRCSLRSAAVPLPNLS